MPEPKSILDAGKFLLDKWLNDKGNNSSVSSTRYAGDPMRGAMTRIEHEVTAPKAALTHAIGTRPETGAAHTLRSSPKAPGPRVHAPRAPDFKAQGPKG